MKNLPIISKKKSKKNRPSANRQNTPPNLLICRDQQGGETEFCRRSNNILLIAMLISISLICLFLIFTKKNFPDISHHVIRQKIDYLHDEMLNAIKKDNSYIKILNKNLTILNVVFWGNKNRQKERTKNAEAA